MDELKTLEMLWQEAVRADLIMKVLVMSAFSFNYEEVEELTDEELEELLCI